MDPAVVQHLPPVPAPKRSELGVFPRLGFFGTGREEWPRWATCVVCWKDKIEVGKGKPREVYRDNNFYVLPCLHLVCSEHCLNDNCLVAEDGKTKCKTCFREFQKRELSEKGRIQPLVTTGMGEQEILKIPKKCDACIRPNLTAILYCIECQQGLCSFCVDYHKVQKDTFRHEMYGSPLLLFNVPAGEVCPTHRNQKLTHHCKTCSELVCDVCVNLNHSSSSHQFQDIEEFLAQLKHEGLAMETAHGELLFFQWMRMKPSYVGWVKKWVGKSAIAELQEQEQAELIGELFHGLNGRCHERITKVLEEIQIHLSRQCDNLVETNKQLLKVKRESEHFFSLEEIQAQLEKNLKKRQDLAATQRIMSAFKSEVVRLKNETQTWKQEEEFTELQIEFDQGLVEGINNLSFPIHWERGTEDGDKVDKSKEESEQKSKKRRQTATSTIVSSSQVIDTPPVCSVVPIKRLRTRSMSSHGDDRESMEKVKMKEMEEIKAPNPAPTLDKTHILHTVTQVSDADLISEQNGKQDGDDRNPALKNESENSLLSKSSKQIELIQGEKDGIVNVDVVDIGALNGNEILCEAQTKRTSPDPNRNNGESQKQKSPLHFVQDATLPNSFPKTKIRASSSKRKGCRSPAKHGGASTPEYINGKPRGSRSGRKKFLLELSSVETQTERDALTGQKLHPKPATLPETDDLFQKFQQMFEGQ